ncbi:hypothetical protein CVT26_013248 [Gymnopilus dilepis]|uniref:Uncharacterized protein n=1 Tax=Gymnopilus dilepis TaxID=231916 RepID=A0A409VUJ1_9AGAR|nr:hypothetical protein CVT26_013248 [Gymnopilus dilepis]
MPSQTSNNGSNERCLYLAAFNKQKVSRDTSPLHAALIVLPNTPDASIQDGIILHVVENHLDPIERKHVWTFEKPKPVYAHRRELQSLMLLGKLKNGVSDDNLYRVLDRVPRIRYPEEDPSWKCHHWASDAVDLLVEQKIVNNVVARGSVLWNRLTGIIQLSMFIRTSNIRSGSIKRRLYLAVFDEETTYLNSSPCWKAALVVLPDIPQASIEDATVLYVVGMISDMNEKKAVWNYDKEPDSAYTNLWDLEGLMLIGKLKKGVTDDDLYAILDKVPVIRHSKENDDWECDDWIWSAMQVGLRVTRIRTIKRFKLSLRPRTATLG